MRRTVDGGRRRAFTVEAAMMEEEGAEKAESGEAEAEGCEFAVAGEARAQVPRLA